MVPGFTGYISRLDSRGKSLLLCAVLASPVIVAIWVVPWFVTPDGPVHLYNSGILSLLARGNPRFSEVYSPRGGLLPYTGTYRILQFLMSFASSRFADRLIMTVTSVGFAASIIWLRARIRGWESMHVVAPLVLAVSFSRLWLYGLYGFFLGACVLLVALGCWWSWRDELRPIRVAVLGTLLALGFFFHIVGAALAIGALAVLAIFTPGTRIKRRLIWTAIAIVPTMLLTAKFVLTMSHSATGGLEWPNLNNALSLGEWLRYVQNADFISISFKSELAGFLLVPTDLPFVRTPAFSYAVLSPFHWALAGLLLLVISTLRGRFRWRTLLTSTYRGWVFVGAGLLIVGFVGPGAFGQGSLFRERLLMLGFVMTLVLVRPPEGVPARIGGWMLFLALIFQIGFVCDYASISNQIAGAFRQAESHVGRGGRVSLITADPRTQYLLTPIPEIVNQLGLDTESVVWNNYGPAYYYFPVTFRDDQALDRWRQIDELNKLTISGKAQAVAEKNPDRWSAAFDDVMSNTDFLIVWGEAPWLDSINSRWFDPEPIYVKGNLRLFKRK